MGYIVTVCVSFALHAYREQKKIPLMSGMRMHIVHYLRNLRQAQTKCETLLQFTIRRWNLNVPTAKHTNTNQPNLINKIFSTQK